MANTIDGRLMAASNADRES